MQERVTKLILDDLKKHKRLRSRLVPKIRIKIKSPEEGGYNKPAFTARFGFLSKIKYPK